MAHLHYPIVGDSVYGGRTHIPKNATPALVTAIQSFPRQALHASKLELQHPVTKELLRLEAPLPDDIKMLINNLENDAKKNR